MIQYDGDKMKKEIHSLCNRVLKEEKPLEKWSEQYSRTAASGKKLLHDVLHPLRRSLLMSYTSMTPL